MQCQYTEEMDELQNQIINQQNNFSFTADKVIQYSALIWEGHGWPTTSRLVQISGRRFTFNNYIQGVPKVTEPQTLIKISCQKMS